MAGACKHCCPVLPFTERPMGVRPIPRLSTMISILLLMTLNSLV